MCISYRTANPDDIPLLARMNHALIQDEGSENPMDIDELAERMRDFLAGEYRAVIFLHDGEIIGYCLYRVEDGYGGQHGIYVRQYYIAPEYRRQGLGKRAFLMLAEDLFSGVKDITLDVLDGNLTGRAFWESVGFVPYSRHMRLKTR